MKWLVINRSILKKWRFLFVLITVLFLAFPLQAQTNFFQKPLPSKVLSSYWQFRWGDSPVNNRGLPDWIFDDHNNRSWSWFEVSRQPSNIHNLKNIWVRVKLPKGKWQDPGLLFLTNDQRFQVFLDGKLIYQFGDLKENNVKTPGSPWHIIPLPPDFQNKIVFFRMHSTFTRMAGLVRLAEIGSRSELLVKIIRDNIDYLILACLFIFLGLGLIIIFAWGSWEQKGFYALGFSSITAGIWLIAETNMHQLLFNLPIDVWTYIAIISFYLMPVGFCIFMEQVFGGRYKLVLRGIWQIYCLFAFVTLLLDLTNIVVLGATLSVYYILLAITIIIVIIILSNGVIKGDTEAKIFSCGIVIFAITGIYDILGWYFRIVPWNRYNTHWGLFIFMLFLVYILRRRYLGIYKKLHDYSHEIEAQNKALNKMWLEVKESRDEIARWNKTLEQRVIERTEQLENANQELKTTLEYLKKTQTQLIESEKMRALGSLVAGVAHEINTPMGVSVTAASHLSQKTTELQKLYQSDQMTRSDLEKFFASSSELSSIILSNLERAANLVRSFKLVTVDQSSEEKRKFNVKEYIQEVLLSLKPKIKKTKHLIEIDCPDDLEIDSYPGAFSQIITNLVMNSLVHAFAEGTTGEIKFSITKNDNLLVFRYSDNGKGIPSENLDKIFNPFFTTMRSQGGTGLGLHIVYNLVVQTLGGSVDCISEPAKGTTFFIKIPLIRSEAADEKH